MDSEANFLYIHTLCFPQVNNSQSHNNNSNVLITLLTLLICPFFCYYKLYTHIYLTLKWVNCWSSDKDSGLRHTTRWWPWTFKYYTKMKSPSAQFKSPTFSCNFSYVKLVKRTKFHPYVQ